MTTAFLNDASGFPGAAMLAALRAAGHEVQAFSYTSFNRVRTKCSCEQVVRVAGT